MIRLTSGERAAITRAVKKRDARATVLLFGSRLDPGREGGDIDLLVVSESISFEEKIQILAEIKAEIGDQKIDLLIATKSRVASDPFFAEAARKGVPL